MLKIVPMILVLFFVVLIMFVLVRGSIVKGQRRTAREQRDIEAERDYQLRLMEVLIKERNQQFLQDKHLDEVALKRYDSHTRAATLSFQREKAGQTPIRGSVAATEASILTAAPHWAPALPAPVAPIPADPVVAPAAAVEAEDDLLPIPEAGFMRSTREIGYETPEGAHVIVGIYSDFGLAVSTIVLRGYLAHKYGNRSISNGSFSYGNLSDEDILNRAKVVADPYIRNLLDGTAELRDAVGVVAF